MSQGATRLLSLRMMEETRERDESAGTWYPRILGRSRYTEYALQVCVFENGAEKDWLVYFRYSKAAELHSSLTKRFGERAVPGFPEKTTTARTDAGFVAARVRSFNRYFEALQRKPDLFTCAELRDFLRFRGGGPLISSQAEEDLEEDAVRLLPLRTNQQTENGGASDVACHWSQRGGTPDETKVCSSGHLSVPPGSVFDDLDSSAKEKRYLLGFASSGNDLALATGPKGMSSRDYVHGLNSMRKNLVHSVGQLSGAAVTAVVGNVGKTSTNINAFPHDPDESPRNLHTAESEKELFPTSSNNLWLNRDIFGKKPDEERSAISSLPESSASLKSAPTTEHEPLYADLVYAAGSEARPHLPARSTRRTIGSHSGVVDEASQQKKLRKALRYTHRFEVSYFRLDGISSTAKEHLMCDLPCTLPEDSKPRLVPYDISSFT